MFKIWKVFGFKISVADFQSILRCVLTKYIQWIYTGPLKEWFLITIFNLNICIFEEKF